MIPNYEALTLGPLEPTLRGSSNAYRDLGYWPPRNFNRFIALHIARNSSHNHNSKTSLWTMLIAFDRKAKVLRKMLESLIACSCTMKVSNCFEPN